MSYYRPNNGTPGEGDKFAWELGNEAVGVKTLNDVGTLRQVPYHFAKLNQTKSYGLDGVQGPKANGSFSAKVQMHAQNWEEEINLMYSKPSEVKIPKKMLHVVGDTPQWSYSVGGYAYRAKFFNSHTSVYIPKPLPPWLTQQLMAS
jgi:hypothetical protein